MASRTLSSTAKLLFAAIVDAARGNRSGLCKIANATLGDRIGRSESEVGRYLIELEAAGLVARQFGKSKNVRVGIAVTWTDVVPDDPGTTSTETPTVRGPSPAGIGNHVPRDSGPGKIPVPEPEIRTGVSILSTEGEKTEADPKPTPVEIAEALKLMVAGKYAPATRSQPTCKLPEIPPSRRVNPPRAISERPPAPPRDAHDLARGIFVDARRAAYVKPGDGRRKTAAEQIEALRQRSAERAT